MTKKSVFTISANILVALACVAVVAFAFISADQNIKKSTIDVNKVDDLTKIGFIGDSITFGSPEYPSAVENEMSLLGDNYEAVNEGVGGATSAMWLPGEPYFDNALPKFQARGVRVVSIMLGTNDAMDAVASSKTSYRINMREIINGLLATGTIKHVILNYPPYMFPAEGSKWSSASYARLESYMKQIDALVNGTTVLQGDTASYSYFKKHEDQLVDGVHPNALGSAHLGGLWAVSYLKLFPDVETESEPIAAPKQAPLLL